MDRYARSPPSHDATAQNTATTPLCQALPVNARVSHYAIGLYHTHPQAVLSFHKAAWEIAGAAQNQIAILLTDMV
jgi:hypothetical protein